MGLDSQRGIIGDLIDLYAYGTCTRYLRGTSPELSVGGVYCASGSRLVDVGVDVEPMPEQQDNVHDDEGRRERARSTCAEIGNGCSHLQTSTQQQPNTHAPRNLVSKRGLAEALAGRELMRWRGLHKAGRDNGQAVPQQRNT